MAVQVQRDDSGGSRAAEWVEDGAGDNLGLQHVGVQPSVLVCITGLQYPSVIFSLRPVSYSSLARSHGAPQWAQHPLSLVLARTHGSSVASLSSLTKEQLVQAFPAC